MKTSIKALLTVSAIAAATITMAAPVQFKAGQRLTADQLNTVSTQVSTVSEALGLAQDGNAVVAPTQTDLNQTIQQAMKKSSANCHQATCSTVVYLIPNQTYTVNTSTLVLPSDVSLSVLGQANATVALNNAQLSLGKNVGLHNVAITSNHNAAVKKQLATSQVNLKTVSFG
jgi:hypothetical protein